MTRIPLCDSVYDHIWDVGIDLRFMCKTMSRASASYLISCKTLSGIESSIFDYM
ncbi:hypothetical protein F383_32594 [Gossypium arboreum]|uniref:Uncharacterized protein n=1 Tax=Gossypium arboreum TaxID=29729 RepID=A0A0B0N596_GOSAR|nr:hypothetical protein F383_32594 [Gossypium arboreum]